MEEDLKKLRNAIVEDGLCLSLGEEHLLNVLERAKRVGDTHVAMEVQQGGGGGEGRLQRAMTDSKVFAKAARRLRQATQGTHLSPRVLFFFVIFLFFHNCACLV